MKISIRPFLGEQYENWNNIVKNSNEGTVFHRLDFLAYHGTKFEGNEHHLIFMNGDTPCGVMPMACFVENGVMIGKSPYGGSYGGPVFDRVLTYSDSMQVVSSLLEFLIVNNIDNLLITLPIHCCYKCYSDTFRLALLEHDFTCIKRDISSVVGLDPSFEMKKRARQAINKAKSSNVQVVHEANIGDFWVVLDATYKKFGGKPTHTIQELEDLTHRFPGLIYVDVAYLDKKPIAGIGCFYINERVNSSFYLCQVPEYQSVQGLSLLINQILERSRNLGVSWFDFGTSSLNQQGRPNLFDFKEGFGAIGQFRETYLWKK